MNATRFPNTITLATAVAAVLLSAAQFAGIASLAAPQQREAAIAAPTVTQLPLVLVVGARDESTNAGAKRLPTVVVTGHAVRTVAKSTIQAPAI